MQGVSKELSAAVYLIYKDSTISNMANILAWAALLMVFPSLARGINDLLNKTLPKMFMKLGNDQEDAIPKAQDTDQR